MHRTQHVVEGVVEGRPELRVLTRPKKYEEERTAADPPRRKKRHRKSSVFWRRRMTAAGLLALAAALVTAVILGAGHGRAASLKEASPTLILARAGGLDISTPIRPRQIEGLGYHPAGNGLVPLSPRGRNLSGNPLITILSGEAGSPVGYFLMASAGRQGPETGALDVGAKAGAPVYAPVSGTITAVRPDPLLEGASVIEIQPDGSPQERVAVAMLGRIKNGVGVDSPVEAGRTRLGTVADSSSVMKNQLSSYTKGPGDHVTVSVYRLD